MSLFQSTTLNCPACRTAVEFEAVFSVNADRRPDLREAILARSFQHQECPGCGAPLRLAPEFNYMDMAGGLWINAAPLAALATWKAHEAQARALFDEVYGEQAPEPARQLGATLRPRITFGWAALREKIVAGQNGLDDVVLELCKAAVMRGSGEPMPVGADTEMRLLAVEGDDLVFGWLRAADEAPGPVVRVSRAMYDEIAADGQLDGEGEWDELRADIDAGLFVDMNRLLIAQPD